MRTPYDHAWGHADADSYINDRCDMAMGIGFSLLTPKYEMELHEKQEKLSDKRYQTRWHDVYN